MPKEQNKKPEALADLASDLTEISEAASDLSRVLAHVAIELQKIAVRAEQAVATPALTQKEES